MDKLKILAKKVVLMLTDKAGWKKDAKKIVLILLGMVFVAGIAFGVSSPAWSLRWHMPVEIVEYQQMKTDSFEFLFSKKFVLDKDDKKKYGNDYIVGFHLADDQRTGCDVRLSSVGINFAKTDQIIAEAIEKDLKANVKEFSNYVAKREMLDGEQAFLVAFDLTDPLSNVLRIEQTIVSHEGKNYLVVCGAGKGQYQFFEKDFKQFMKSMRWK